MSFVEVNVASPCGNVVLSRVDKRNALNREAISELAQAFSDLHQEKKVRAVILTGSGGNFCSGLDLNEMHTVCQGDSQTALARWHEDWVRLKDLLETMLRFPKPIIAAVDGVALGAGLGLVLGADIVLASTESVFGIPTARRGLISGVVPPLLNFRAGAKATARLLLTGEDISAEEAHRLSIVDEVLPASSLMNRAREYAQACAASPAESIQLSKRLLNETIGEQMLTQMSVGAAMGATSCTTEAAAEGLSAFIEKRAPLWP